MFMTLTKVSQRPIRLQE